MGKSNKKSRKTPADPPDIIQEDEDSQAQDKTDCTDMTTGTTTRSNTAMQKQIDRNRSEMKNLEDRMMKSQMDMIETIGNQMETLMEAVTSLQPTQGARNTEGRKNKTQIEEAPKAKDSPEDPNTTANRYDEITVMSDDQGSQEGQTIQVMAQIHGTPAVNTTGTTSSGTITQAKDREPTTTGTTGREQANQTSGGKLMTQSTRQRSNSNLTDFMTGGQAVLTSSSTHSATQVNQGRVPSFRA